jgi:serine/threonine-protein kinase RIO1
VSEFIEERRCLIILFPANLLFSSTSILRLYVGARLVHGDLSEYNILVAPVFQVDNPISSVEDTTNDLQAVLIDFGQAVDLRHPEAMNLLRRDLDRVRAFFKKQGVKTLDLEEAVEFVVDDFANEVFNESSNTLGVQNSLVDASVVE